MWFGGSSFPIHFYSIHTSSHFWGPCLLVSIQIRRKVKKTAGHKKIENTWKEKVLLLVLSISWGERLPPYTHPSSDGPTTYQHCWTTTTRIHFSSLEDGWLDIWLSLNKARYSAVSQVLTISLLSTIKRMYELSLEELFKLDQYIHRISQIIIILTYICCTNFPLKLQNSSGL